MSALLWLKDNWRLALFLALLALFTIQSYRLRGAQADVRVLTLEKVERAKRDALRQLADKRNQERTDEEYAAASRRAAVVRVQPATPGVVTSAGVAASDSAATICLDGRALNEQLTGWSQRAAARLTRLIADVSQRDSERLSAVAAQGEELAAAYRACRAYTLNLSNAPGEEGNAVTVGGGPDVLPSPVSH